MTALPTPDSSAFLLPPGVLYLDTAAHGPRLRTVQAAACEALEAGARPWQACWDEWEAQVERVRALASRLFDGDTDGVALVPSAGYGLSLAARNLPLAAGDAVLVLADTFPSNLLPWQHRCRETGARLLAVERGIDATAAVLAALERESRVRVVSLPHVHWHDGALLDLDAIAEAVHARGAALVLDLTQSLGALPAAVARWRPAFAVAASYKWLLGPMGLAWLWASPHAREHGTPIEHHWLAYEARADWSFSADMPAAWRTGARRFDAGGIADPVRLAMAEAGLLQLQAWGVDAIRDRLGALTAALVRGLDRSRFAMPAAHAPHFVGVRPRCVPLDACARALTEAGIVCTARHGALRIAPHLHVGLADIERVVAVLDATG
jgi:selenocysteine lyase/cysteine desulfurase